MCKSPSSLATEEGAGQALLRAAVFGQRWHRRLREQAVRTWYLLPSCQKPRWRPGADVVSLAHAAQGGDVINVRVARDFPTRLLPPERGCRQARPPGGAPSSAVVALPPFTPQVTAGQSPWACLDKGLLTAPAPAVLRRCRSHPWADLSKSASSFASRSRNGDFRIKALLIFLFFIFLMILYEMVGGSFQPQLEPGSPGSGRQTEPGEEREVMLGWARSG